MHSIDIFEMGFGTGLNCLLTLLSNKATRTPVNYSAIELHPLPMEVTNDLNYPDILKLSETDRRLFLRMHSLAWDTSEAMTDNFTLHKIYGDILKYNFRQKFNLIYFDAFAFSSQPILWSPELHQKLYDHLHPGGVMTTYSTKGVFKRTLKSIGYKLEILNGPGKKREMLRAVKI